MDFNKTYLSFRLHDDFVNKYKNKKPNFGFNGLGYAVYARTYSRLTCDDCNSLFINEDDNGELYCESCKSKNIRNEKWFETVRRVVEGTYSIQKDWIINRNLGWNEEKGIRSAKTMYRLIFEMKFLPPGRGLWAMGTPLVHQKKMFAALNNCAFVSTSNMDKNPTKPFEFMMDMSMLGVGVGFDCLGENSITINKPNKKLKTFIIEDTREGWVESVKVLLESYFYSNKAKIQFDYSKIRKYGKLIKGFGGRSSGKEPLIVLHEDIVKYLDRNINKLITLRSIADIMNSIGVCVVAGNVRRTAQMMLGDYSDNNYISLKDYTINPDRESFGWTSNNSVFANIGMNYSNVSEKIAKNGEPGLIWLENIKNYSRMGNKPDYKDIRAEGVNPCSEQSLESFELCCLVETFPTNHNILNEFEITLKYSYLYAKTVTLGETHWPETNRVLLRNRRIGNSMSGLAIFVADNGLNELKKWSLSGYSTIAKWDKIYSEWFAVPASIKTTSIKPSGSVSLLAGVTPGMHYPINRCYIRRMNIAKNSDLVKILSDAGYEYEDSAYDDTSYSFSFPIKLDDNIRAQDELSIWEQFSFASFLQRYWADNQVSCTISFDYATEKNEIEKCLDYFQYELKGISLLPRFNNNKKAYKQMPYEGISQEKYEHLNSKINNVDVSRNIKEMSESERFCDGDSCTIL